MIKRIRNRFKNEKGQGMVEYGLILALVSIMAIGSLSILGGKVNGAFEKVNGVIGGDMADVIPEDAIVANDSEFEWKTTGGITSTYYRVPGEAQPGYYAYVGTGTDVTIPHEIKGEPLTSYSNMFYEFNQPSIKVRSYNSKLVSTEGMFQWAEIKSLDLSEFNTLSVSNMSTMFRGMGELTSLDMSSFNTSKVTSMRAMFQHTGALPNLDLTHFDTSKVVDMRGMFSGVNMPTLDISSFDTSNVVHMNATYKQSGDGHTIGYQGFFDAAKIDNIILGNKFTTSKVENMGRMFSNSKIGNIEDVLLKIDTSAATDLSGMFERADLGSMGSLNKSSLKNFDTSKVTQMFATFRDTGVDIIDLSGLDTSKVETMHQAFASFKGSTIDMSTSDLSSLTNSDKMFWNATSTQAYGSVGNIGTLNATSNKPDGLIFTVK